MTPVYLSTSSSPFLAVDQPEEDDHDHHHFQLFIATTTTTPPSNQASSSHFSSPAFFNTSQAQSGISHRLPQHHEEDKYISNGRSSDHLQTVVNDTESSRKLWFWKKEEGDESKWTSSKMRLMRKMTNSNSNCTATDKQAKFERENEEIDSSNNSNTPIRVCSECSTTKTPLWRSGPRGPKSLCNACGIRQRKARRAMAAAAAAAASGTAAAAETSLVKTKLNNREKKMHSNSGAAQHKKLCKPACPPHTKKKICFEDLTSSLSKNSAFRRVFPQDEEEAAILLMALSCGLVYS